MALLFFKTRGSNYIQNETYQKKKLQEWRIEISYFLMSLFTRDAFFTIEQRIEYKIFNILLKLLVTT
jgi:hypothetical protein